ncbi:MAG: pyrroloquinoline quinone-dependent dehydrogenase [Pseudomonadota bacterium]
MLRWGLFTVLAVIAALLATGDIPSALLAGGDHSLDVNGEALIVAPDAPAQEGWSDYGATPGGSRYSSHAQITRENVTDLQVAWSFSTGDMEKRPESVINRMAAEGTPLLVGGALIFCTPFNEVIALDPGTGEAKWRYDPEIDLEQRPGNQFVCRGLAADERSDGGATLYMATTDGRLIALDAMTGAPMTDFGEKGEVRIDPGMDMIWRGEFQITSPPIVSAGTVIVGSSISDNVRVDAPIGAVRAYDAQTGAMKWSFDPIPREPGAPNAGDWRGPQPPAEGHANVWAPMSVDHERGLVFLPTSSPSPDFYGGLRPGDNRYANSVVALDIETGEVRWAFQTVHHDVWDYDVPAQPGLYAIREGGAPRDVVAVATKTGFIFVLDRDTGEPVLPVAEVPTPQGGAPGEALSPTQPFPVATPPIVPSGVTPGDAWGVTGVDKLICRKAIAGADNEGLFTPPSERGALLRPFTGGGANWGGTAFDPRRNLLVVNMSNLVHHIQLIPTDALAEAREAHHDAEIGPQAGAPYAVKREILWSPLGLPCTKPPWGVIAGIDLANGQIVWRRTLGTVEDLSGGLAKWTLGTPNLGGPIITGGDLVFIGATMDDYLRAFDVSTGDELWKGRLPGGGQATPMTYEWRGRQYVVIYAGGHSRGGTRLNDRLVAFALPNN